MIFNFIFVLYLLFYFADILFGGVLSGITDLNINLMPNSLGLLVGLFNEYFDLWRRSEIHLDLRASCWIEMSCMIYGLVQNISMKD